MKKVLTFVFSLYFLNIFSNNTNIDLPDSANKELYSTVEKIILKQKTQKYEKDKKNKLLKYGVLFSILCLEHLFLWKFWNYKNKNEALSGLKASALREIPLTASSEALNEGWKPYSSVDSSLLFSAETEKDRNASMYLVDESGKLNGISIDLEDVADTSIAYNDFEIKQAIDDALDSIILMFDLPQRTENLKKEFYDLRDSVVGSSLD